MSKTKEYLYYLLLLAGVVAIAYSAYVRHNDTSMLLLSNYLAMEKYNESINVNKETQLLVKKYIRLTDVNMELTNKLLKRLTHE